MELNEKESHCVARLLQSAIFGKSLFNGCLFCKFRCAIKNDPAPHFDTIRKKIYDETGVDLGFGSESNLPFSDFPYKRFLKNADESIKTHFREVFASV